MLVGQRPLYRLHLAEDPLHAANQFVFVTNGMGHDALVGGAIHAPWLETGIARAKGTLPVSGK
jgi:hypothetical protein